MKKDKEYYEGLDKRTTEYKTWAKFNKIESTEYQKNWTKNVIEAVDSVIKERKQILRPLTKEHYEAYKEYKEKRTLDVWGSIDMLVDTYAHVFALQHNKLELTKESKGAFKKLSKMSRELDVVFESYNNKNKG